MMSLSRIGVALSTVVLFSGCGQRLWIHKDFDAIRSDIDNISIVFPHVEYYKKFGEGKKAQWAHSIFVSKNVSGILKEVIEEGAFIPGSGAVESDSLVIRYWVPRYFLDSIRKYQIVDKSIQESKDGAKIFPITSELKMLVDESDSKYFLFVNGVAFGASKETKEFDILQAQTFELMYDQSFAYDYNWYGLQLSVYLIERESNKILWHNHNNKRDSRYNPLNKQEVKDLCLRLLDQT